MKHKTIVLTVCALTSLGGTAFAAGHGHGAGSPARASTTPPGLDHGHGVHHAYGKGHGKGKPAKA